MAFVVEDGTGLPTATAYVSVQGVRDYLRDRCGEGWGGPDTQLESAIVRATDFVDRHFDFKGDILNRGDVTSGTDRQALKWPRKGAIHPEGYLVEEDAVPREVVQATSELARVALACELDEDIRVGGARTVTETVGRVSANEAFGSPGGSTQIVLPRATTILRPLLSGGGSFGTSKVVRT